MEPDLSKIKAFAFDVDGVMTDGGIFCDLQGNLYRTYDAKDGFAIRMAVMNGYPVGVITGGRSSSIRERFKTSGVKPEDVYLGSRDKIRDFDDFWRSSVTTSPTWKSCWPQASGWLPPMPPPRRRRPQTTYPLFPEGRAASGNYSKRR